MNKKKRYNLNFVRVGTPDQSAAIVRRLAKNEISKVLSRHGAVPSNLDEILEKYIRVK